jgi:hypothetical protein
MVYCILVTFIYIVCKSIIEALMKIHVVFIRCYHIGLRIFIEFSGKHYEGFN